jgi:hypothetical protein
VEILIQWSTFFGTGDPNKSSGGSGGKPAPLDDERAKHSITIVATNLITLIFSPQGLNKYSAYDTVAVSQTRTQTLRDKRRHDRSVGLLQALV